jgi:hypothetical protein
VPFDVGSDVRVGADGARDRTDAHGLARPDQSLRVALQLGEPAGCLEAERDRLGVDPVRASDHGGVAVLDREAPNDLDEARQLVQHDARRVAEHDCGRRVEDVRAREPVVEPATLRPKSLRQRTEEGDDVML